MLQIFATLVSVIGLVIAITFSAIDAEFSGFDQAHQIIGIIVVSVLFIQALLGYQNHRVYRKTGHRTVLAQPHIWSGRVVIILGMVNAVL